MKPPTLRSVRSLCERVTAAKNSCDWPLNSPLAVRPSQRPCGALVWVGRTIEQIGNFRSRKTVGSGMIRFVCSVLADGRSGRGTTARSGR